MSFLLSLIRFERSIFFERLVDEFHCEDHFFPESGIESFLVSRSILSSKRFGICFIRNVCCGFMSNYCKIAGGIVGGISFIAFTHGLD